MLVQERRRDLKRIEQEAEITNGANKKEAAQEGPDLLCKLPRRAAKHGSKYDVAELYSPARVTRLAAARGLSAGRGFDSKHVDPLTGRTYDFLKKTDQDEVTRLLTEVGADVLTVSPPCTLFSNLQHRIP